MNNEVPELKLDGAEAATELEAAAGAAQAAIADLDNTVESAMHELQTIEIKDLDKLPPEEANYLKNIQLTEAEQRAVDEFKEKIDITDTNVIMQYGASCQKKIADFSDSALEGVKTKDLGEVSGMITDLVTELKGFSLEPQKKGLFGLFKKVPVSIEKIKAEYASADTNIDKIVESLEKHQNTLSKDVVMLDKLYEANLGYFKELSMYIMAGKAKLEEERAGKLQELKAKAEQSGLPEDAQAANDFAALCDRFEKKLFDLELTRTISIQMAPQIRMIQNNDVLMVERIQSTINNTIPLWKNQMVLALGMAHSKQAADAQHAVNELTNELLKKNAETLKTGSIEIAQESERSVVDIETVKETNQKLIETFDEVMKIQEEARNRRAEAEAELGRIEVELKNKLLDIKG
ncbi:MAG: toxic anion resistance protein [Firmicutes bacterium]|nr:toxic anion resistance protein [Bacillota bacterium]MBQ4371473.1 toxic anion resistance protein [Bacillota bacterium]